MDSFSRSANASSPLTPSPGSMITPSRVSSQATMKPFCWKGPAAWISINMVGHDSSDSRRPDVHVEDQNHREADRRYRHVRAIGQRRAERDAEESAGAGDSRPEQPEDESALHRPIDEGRSGAGVGADAGLRVARGHGDDQRRAAGGRRRDPRAVRVHDAARRDSRALMIDALRARKRI